VQVCGGKVLRDGQGQKAGATDAQRGLLITNALILDWTGSTKRTSGIKHGRIAGSARRETPTPWRA